MLWLCYLDFTLTLPWPFLNNALNLLWPYLDLYFSLPWCYLDLALTFPWPCPDLVLVLPWPSLDIRLDRLGQLRSFVRYVRYIYIFRSIVIYTNVYKALAKQKFCSAHGFPLRKNFSVCPDGWTCNASLTQARFCLHIHKNCILTLCPVGVFVLYVLSFFHYHHLFYHILSI